VIAILQLPVGNYDVDNLHKGAEVSLMLVV